MRLRTILAMLFALLVLAGCSGGGGGDNGPGGGASGRVGLFITDDLNAGYDNVWVTVRSVQLRGPSGDRTLFDDTNGFVVDLKALGTPAGQRFLFLANAAIPSGVYSSVRVVVDKDLTIIPTGGTGRPAVFEGSDAETKTLEVSFPAPRRLGADEDLVVDFDLATWTENAGVVSAPGGQFLKFSNGQGLNDINRHEDNDYHGNVANLSGDAPDLTFNLTRGIFSVRVQTDANTTIFNENGTQTPVLTNGRRVEVRGVYDNSANVLRAISIKIEDGPGDNDEDEAKGPASSLSEAAGTFELDVRKAEGFLPDTNRITVRTTDTTRFVSDRGVTLKRAEFFARLAATTEVEVEGTFDDATNTLTARKAKLEDEDDNDDDEDESEVEGPVSQIDTTARTFRVTAREWEGLNIGLNDVINVQTTANTLYRDRKDQINAETFFAGLANGRRVEVEGSFNTSTDTLRAVKVKFEDDDDDGDDNGGDDDNSGPGGGGSGGGGGNSGGGGGR